jgi:hypothetical protein
MFLQKGIGRMIRRRLRRRGLLSDTAQQQNAELAREGSVDGTLSTIDLSSASDSIHLELVRELLPFDWVEAIENSRSPYCVLPSGELKLLRKVASMGNGYCFELETLIFWALAEACSLLLDASDRRCAVYGDDIIVPTSVAQALLPVLEDCGFSVNLKKTFLQGPFRESCGKHYFLGVDVTPFYVRAPIDSIERVFWAANSVKRFSRLPGWGLDERFKLVHEFLVSRVSPFWRRMYVPEGYGDGGFIGDFDEARPRRASVRENNQVDGWSFRSVIPKVSIREVGGPATMLKSLHFLEQRGGADSCDNLLSALIRSERVRAGMAPYDRSLSGVKGNEATVHLPVLNGKRIATLVATKWQSFGPWLTTTN